MVNKKIITAFIISILSLIIIFIVVQSLRIKRVTINTIYDLIKDSDYTLVFSGDYNNDIYKELKQLRETYGFNVFVCSNEREDVIDYLYEFSDLSDEDEEPQGNLYIIYDRTGLLGYIDDSMNKEEYIKKYLYNYIPVNERRYNVPTVDELKELYYSKNKTILVLGNDECSFCSKLEQVINTIASKNQYQINYINFSRITDVEVNQIYELNLIVPKECNKSGEETNIKDGYAKPMTLITKKGKVIGCIKGYYDTSTYLSKLKDIME